MLRVHLSVGHAALAIAGLFTPVLAQARPNILWITSEDNAAHWLGCYGNRDARTPRLDALAEQGVRFERAYSNAPVCAVARSTILTGVHAISQGTQHMRSRHPIPSSLRTYVSILREAGYYCTNRSKTDFNIRGNDRAVWDECSRKAHYENRPGAGTADAAPFFSIFNLTVSHESCLFPQRIARNRKNGTIPQTPRLAPEELTLPPYLPDLPEVRADFAVYHDVMTALDRRVGQLLDRLERDGLTENTIVFYFADHGGPTPRGKRYLKDTGVRVPMLLRVPDRFAHLSPFDSGTSTTEIVGFVDLAPTLLSLTGIEVPSHMQGRAFLGHERSEAPPVALLYGDRFDEIYGMRRGLTDGRFKYVRRFTPDQPAAPYSHYALGMRSWRAMRDAYRAGHLDPVHARMWQPTQPLEELFDLSADPWEVHNLAEEPTHAQTLHRMRSRLRAEQLRIRDTGIVPEALFAELSGDATLFEAMRREGVDYAKLLDRAWSATAVGASTAPEPIVEQLRETDPVARYWAVRALRGIGPKTASAVPSILTALEQALDDHIAAVRIAAADALCALGRTNRGTTALLAELDRTDREYELLAALNALRAAKALDRIPEPWLRGARTRFGKNHYVRRFVDKVIQQK